VLMLPAHVVLTEMVIDPLCSFAFEGVPADADLMARGPRAREDHVFRWASLRGGLLAGLLLLTAVLAVWLAALARGLAADEARTLAILALTAGNLALVWALARPRGAGHGPPGRPLLVVTVLSAAALAAGIGWPAGRALLQFALPTPQWLAAALALGAAAGAAAGWMAARRRIPQAAPATHAA